MKFTSKAAVFSLTLTASMLAAAQGYGVDQTEKEFQQLMPRTGTVETFFGDFELDHSFPAEGEADRIYDILDHQRASQLYLWGLPIVAMTRWHQGYVQSLKDYDYYTIVHASTYNERRGILTPTESTEYFWGFANTREAPAILEIPKGVTVGMIADMWEQGPSDIGLFGPFAVEGGVQVFVGPNTPEDGMPYRAKDQRIVRVETVEGFVLERLFGTPEEVMAISANL